MFADTHFFRLAFVKALGLTAILFGSTLHADETKPVIEYLFDDTEEKGPREPEYTEHSKDNTARKFASAKGAIIVKSSDELNFAVGDSITVEAWVKVDKIGSGHMPYLIGKGRHDGGTSQNYALRLKADESGTRVGFLFASEETGNDSAEPPPRDWHRWWSSMTLPSGEWHHVAVAYTFGEPDSLRAYIDGRSTKGTWDMGGKTSLGPVADDSDLVIGTGYQRSGSQTFNGSLDNVRIYRAALSEEALLGRFNFIPPPPPLTRDMLKPGKILVQISEEGVPDEKSWPHYPEVAETYSASAFGFFDWPQKYVGTGVRGERSNPSHFRAAALVKLPKGKHRLLLRGRGMSRLFIDEKEVISSPGSRIGGDNNPLSKQDDYLDLGPDFRFSPPGNSEKSVEFESKGGVHFIILESLIGGGGRRPEFGETVVAISPEGSEYWELLTPEKERIAYNDEGWTAYESQQQAWLDQENARRREEKRNEHKDYWSMRREAAKEWLNSKEPIQVPELANGLPSNNEVDHFIGAQIATVSAASTKKAAGGVSYFDEVQPLLEAKCYSCHKGSKIKGGLRLDTLEASLAGGDADGPAITPGKVEESSLIWRIHHDAEDDIMPPKGDPLSEEEIALLEKWVEEGANWPQFNVDNFEPTPLTGDLTFLRRLALDTVGVPPTEAEIDQFLNDPEPKRRSLAIDRFLKDSRWADNWMGYWQDVLAENPNIINPTLNNTGPFRWWIEESLIDNKPLDLFVTELIRMEGSDRLGGPRGFGTASGNDVPMAAKGIIVSAAFLGVEMKCARCHDATAHEWMQQDLFEIAAMLKQDSIKLPMTSSVPMEKLDERERKPLIQVTLKPGTTVEPAWPFEQFSSMKNALTLTQTPDSKRDVLAALITAPENERFAEVMANRIWQRLMGRGIIATVHDWESSSASHPALLKWLGRELVASGYDTKAIAKIVFNSHAYQRTTDPSLRDASPLYIAPAPRRLQAEQIVDSLFSATGKPFDVGEVTLDIDSGRALSSSISLGKPDRAWMLASTSNERDRPSLSLPKVTAVSSIMKTFGWRGARQDPVSVRNSDENVLQPAILANGTMGVWLTRLSEDHGITSFVMEDQSVETLVDRLYMRLLTRKPTPTEKEKYVSYLSSGYEDRVIPKTDREQPASKKRERERYLSWSNHLDPGANELAVVRQMEVRAGDPHTNALREDWRNRMEDVLWALLNAPEWIYTP